MLVVCNSRSSHPTFNNQLFLQSHHLSTSCFLSTYIRTCRVRLDEINLFSNKVQLTVRFLCIIIIIFDKTLWHVKNKYRRIFL